MKSLKIFVCSAVIFLATVFSCSAQVYESSLPSYCPNSGGAFAEVSTSQGRACFVVGRDCIFNVFSFYGTSGYNILNSTSQTVSGAIYFQNATNYYSNPRIMDCRFLANGTLQVYEPYLSGYNNQYVSYRWTDLPTSAIYNTNIGFIDNSLSDRQNNELIYTRPEKIQIIILCLVGAILLYFLLGRAWHA